MNHQNLLSKIATVLQVPDVSGDENFFDLGGDSLAAIELAEILSEHLGRDVDIAEVTSAVTLDTLILAEPGAVRPIELPCSDMQQDWWVREQTYRNPDLVIARQAMVHAPLDHAAFAAAARAVVRRHDALRARFPQTDGHPRLRVEHPDVGFEPWFARVESLDELRPLMIAERAFVFDLTQGPLVRIGAVELGNDAFVVALTVHHIVADGPSVQIVYDDLSEAYMSGGLDERAPARSLAGWVAAEDEWNRSVGGRQELEYWRGALSGLAPVELMPAPDPTAHYRQATLIAELDPELRSRLASTASALRTTVSVLLHTAALVQQSSLLGRTDCATMAIFSRRTARDTHDLVGCVGNSVTLRVDVSADLRTTVRRTMRAMLEARKHQRTFVTRVWDAAGLRPTDVDFLLIYDPPPEEPRPLTFGGAPVAPYTDGYGEPWLRQGVRLWENLKLRVSDDGCRLTTYLDYNGLKCTAEAAGLIVDAYLRALEEVAALADELGDSS